METIGDCYVAVAGLPDPRPDHAVVMARFAHDVLSRMNTLTKELETSLGPGTSSLILDTWDKGPAILSQTDILLLVTRILPDGFIDTSDLAMRVGLHSGPVSHASTVPLGWSKKLPTRSTDKD